MDHKYDGYMVINIQEGKVENDMMDIKDGYVGWTKIGKL